MQVYSFWQRLALMAASVCEQIAERLLRHERILSFATRFRPDGISWSMVLQIANLMFINGWCVSVQTHACAARDMRRGALTQRRSLAARHRASPAITACRDGPDSHGFKGGLLQHVPLALCDGTRTLVRNVPVSGGSTKTHAHLADIGNRIATDCNAVILQTIHVRAVPPPRVPCLHAYVRRARPPAACAEADDPGQRVAQSCQGDAGPAEPRFPGRCIFRGAARSSGRIPRATV
jgi:hypothetical protein